MADKYYVGDIGIIITIDMGEDISTGLNLILYVLKPNGEEVEWTPTIYNTNYLKYTITEDDIDVGGVYYINPYLELGSWKGFGETVNFRVYDEFM